MALKRYLELVERVDSLIKKKATGRPPEMAAKLGLSLRAVSYTHLDVYKRQGLN